MHKVTSIPFKRMMLVDEMMLQKLKEDAITGYNATAKTMVQHKDAMDSALRTLNGGPLADDKRLALYLANEQRFQQLLRNATANATDRKAVTSSAAQAMPSQMVQTDPTAETTQGVQTETEVATQGTDTSEEAAGGYEKPDESLAKQFRIPAQYEKKLDAVAKAMVARRDVISVTEDNELVVGGKVQRGTSFADLMRSLFVESSSPATGLSTLIGALHSIGVTEDMLSAKRAKEAMRSIATPSQKLPKAEVKGEAKQSGHGRRKVPYPMTRLLPPGNHVRVLKLYK